MGNTPTGVAERQRTPDSEHSPARARREVGDDKDADKWDQPSSHSERGSVWATSLGPVGLRPGWAGLWRREGNGAARGGEQAGAAATGPKPREKERLQVRVGQKTERMRGREEFRFLFFFRAFSYSFSNLFELI